jgi:predicted transcriptional regulator
MIGVKQIIIKIGGDPKQDLLKAAHDSNVLKAGTHTIYVKDAAQAHRLISSENMNLLMHSWKFNANPCVSDLIKSTGRKQEAISRNLTQLESIGAIKKIKKGRKVFIEPKIDSIEIRFK